MEIKTDILFDKELKKSMAYALEEFGRKTAVRWRTQYRDIRHRIILMPESFSLVLEFRNKTKVFRGATIMKNFKIIYYYNEKLDVVWLVDLWDLRQDPRKLQVRARRIERKNYH